jgi:acetoin utilization deacetylase AcuC-like enzyme
VATGVVFSEEFKRHDTGDGHPESAARMDAVSRALRSEAIASRLELLTPRPAEREEILLVHWEHLYDEIVQTSERNLTYLDSDTVASRHSSEVAHLAAGASLTAIEAVMEGRVSNAFSLARPPGHHAKPDKAMGFCLFNNVAVGATFAQKRFQLERILVLDFDVHHGNGTQKAFYTSPEILYVSTHQWPLYPGTGALSEVGKDDGAGYTINIPLPSGAGNEELAAVFREVVVPVGREFSPELVLVSAGFDAHRDDPLGGMAMSADGYAALASDILEIADEACGGKVVLVLEGGYNLVALEESIVSVLDVMSGGKAGEIRPGAASATAADPVVADVRQLHGQYWECLRA